MRKPVVEEAAGRRGPSPAWWRRAVELAVGLALVAAPLAGCGTVWGPEPSATVTTASPAWEYYFRVAWDVESERAGSRRITGYVHNERGDSMINVLLLAQALDASGSVVRQRLLRLPGSVEGFGRAYFEFRDLPPADRYRVTVWAFEPVQSGGVEL